METWILYHHLTASIQFHNTLHGFRTIRGMRTTFFKANLLYQLTSIRGEVICEIFLDPHKARDALDCGHGLDNLVAYGVGP